MRELGGFPERKLKQVQCKFNQPNLGCARTVGRRELGTVRSLGCTPGSGGFVIFASALP